ncbi:MAG: MobC family plasmid mobilization relaxosome protein [Muribaculum sp.]|nr:MobC family plasmid mobilization relaxosome protein [Muribaculum sp.]
MKNRRERRPTNWVKRVEYDERKCIVKTAKFSLAELDEAYSRQRKAGYKSFSAFLRDCVLNTKIIERVSPEQLKLINEMARLGNNLNQIARACNVGQCQVVADAALQLMSRLDAICDLFNSKNR